MKLSLGQVRDMARGVVDVAEEDGVFSFFRFTKEQSEAYARTGNRDFHEKTFATADVRFAFETNSPSLSFDYRFLRGSSREFGSFDVYEDGAMTGHFGLEIKDDDFHHAEIALSEGVKKVELYFPWSRNARLADIALADGASFKSLRRPRSLICFGDSITHGYDAKYPSLSYTNILARALDADGVNKAIGGDQFFPELLETADPVAPDFITVAYGTNDWRHHDREFVEKRATAFYHRLAALYPAAHIFALSPLWRDARPSESPFGESVSAVHTVIENAVAGLPNVSVVRGYNLVPHLPEFFSDLRLHPNDAGFAIYAANLAKAINAQMQALNRKVPIR